MKGLRQLAIVNYSGSSQVLVSTCGVRGRLPGRHEGHVACTWTRSPVWIVRTDRWPSGSRCPGCRSGIFWVDGDPEETFFLYSIMQRGGRSYSARTRLPKRLLPPYDPEIVFVSTETCYGKVLVICNATILISYTMRWAINGPLSPDSCNGAVRGRGFSPYGPNREPIPLSLRPTFRASAALQTSYPVCRER